MRTLVYACLLWSACEQHIKLFAPPVRILLGRQFFLLLFLNFSQNKIFMPLFYFKKKSHTFEMQCTGNLNLANKKSVGLYIIIVVAEQLESLFVLILV